MTKMIFKLSSLVTENVLTFLTKFSWHNVNGCTGLIKNLLGRHVTTQSSIIQLRRDEKWNACCRVAVVGGCEIIMIEWKIWNVGHVLECGNDREFWLWNTSGKKIRISLMWKWQLTRNDDRESLWGEMFVVNTHIDREGIITTSHIDNMVVVLLWACVSFCPKIKLHFLDFIVIL